MIPDPFTRPAPCASVARWVLVAALVPLLMLPACATYRKRLELEGVARDWCFTIRASQVLPVYPLSEDVQPGDLYLVQLPIDRQQEAYEQRGFLPLDNLVYRLSPSGYVPFYRDSFDLGGTAAPLPESLVKGDGSGWSRAPAAAFPSYGFSVKSGVGAKVAIPVNGVPVGLSFMNSDAAEGTITISDVRTYGLDTVSLLSDVLTWADGNQPFLADFAPARVKKWGLFPSTRQNYLRVVSRVYVTRKVNVSLRDSSSQGAGADVGVPKAIDLFEAKTSEDPGSSASENYQSTLSAVNSAIDKALEVGGAVAPGGSLKVVAASSRSISMEETFPKPLVIGYLGFDLAILENGRLGPPMPSYAVLAKNETPTEDSLTWDDSASRQCISKWLGAEGDQNEIKRRVGELVAWWRSQELPEPNLAPLKMRSEQYRAQRARFLAEKGIQCDG